MGTHLVIHGGAGFIIGRSYAVMYAKIIKRRVILIGQAVGGDVLNRQVCCNPEVMPLDIGSLAGKAVHKVDTYVLNTGLTTDTDSINGLF